MTRLNVIDARCEALFASGLQRSDEPTAEAVAGAISRAVRELGTRGCAARMAQSSVTTPRRRAITCAGPGRSSSPARGQRPGDHPPRRLAA
jgi:hypothetical protein